MNQAYFDRTVPFFLTEEPTFDGVKVDVDPIVVQNVKDFQRLLNDMYARIDRAPAPEESAQDLCDYFSEEIRKIFKTRKQDNLQVNRPENRG